MHSNLKAVAAAAGVLGLIMCAGGYLLVANAATTDDFATYAQSLVSGARKAVVIDPNDALDLEYVPRALHVGVGGDVQVTFVDDPNAVLLKGLVSGGVYPYRVKRVWSTNTTATNLVAVR